MPESNDDDFNLDLDLDLDLDEEEIPSPTSRKPEDNSLSVSEKDTGTTDISPEEPAEQTGEEPATDTPSLAADSDEDDLDIEIDFGEDESKPDEKSADEPDPEEGPSDSDSFDINMNDESFSVESNAVEGSADSTDDDLEIELDDLDEEEPSSPAAAPPSQEKPIPDPEEPEAEPMSFEEFEAAQPISTDEFEALLDSEPAPPAEAQAAEEAADGEDVPDDSTPMTYPEFLAWLEGDTAEATDPTLGTTIAVAEIEEEPVKLTEKDLAPPPPVETIGGEKFTLTKKGGAVILEEKHLLTDRSQMGVARLLPADLREVVDTQEKLGYEVTITGAICLKTNDLASAFRPRVLRLREDDLLYRPDCHVLRLTNRDLAKNHRKVHKLPEDFFSNHNIEVNAKGIILLTVDDLVEPPEEEQPRRKRSAADRRARVARSSNNTDFFKKVIKWSTWITIICLSASYILFHFKIRYQIVPETNLEQRLEGKGTFSAFSTRLDYRLEGDWFNFFGRQWITADEYAKKEQDGFMTWFSYVPYGGNAALESARKELAPNREE